MMVDVFSFSEKNRIGSVDLSESTFNLDPRHDLIKLVIDWQRISRIAGTKGVKKLSEVSGTGKKPFAQKGTGNARRGTNRAPHMRGGALAHSVSKNLTNRKINKKVRFLGLIHALSYKFRSNSVFVVEDFEILNHRTSELHSIARMYGYPSSLLMIDHSKVGINLYHAVRNLPNAKALPMIGANVYDLIKHDTLIIRKSVLSSIQENKLLLLGD